MADKTTPSYDRDNSNIVANPNAWIGKLADAIALVLAGLDNRTLSCLFLRHSYMLYHIPDDSITTLVLLLG
jgi:hypothetical protein